MTSSASPLPPLPRLVLRVGFAGSRLPPTDMKAESAFFDAILETLARRLAEIAPATPIEAPTPEPAIRRYFSSEKPLLRLVTGLCEGGEAVAAHRLQVLSTLHPLNDHLETELAAVIPFSLADYRASRPAQCREEFDALAKRCTYILALDGLSEKPEPDTALAKNRRARAYRAQSTMLLRHIDLLIATASPDTCGPSEETMEISRAALDFGLPVVVLNIASGAVSIVAPGDELISALAGTHHEPVDASSEHGWITQLRHSVTSIVADPEVMSEHEASHPTNSETAASMGQRFLEEYFFAAGIPPRGISESGIPSRQPSFNEFCWNVFERMFRPGPRPKADPALKSYENWRLRATSLNYHYLGLYRGAFLNNYCLAAAAVSLAALSLVLLARAGAGMDELSHVNAVPGWLFPTLLTLGLMKLGCVWMINRNTRRANNGDWNDKAVDYRYLAERLRTMFYLPRIGSFQPPAAAFPHYASRVIRQSVVDWLLDAIVRSVSPAAPEINLAVRVGPSNGVNYPTNQICIKPLRLLEDVTTHWLQEQSVYHERNGRLMNRMNSWVENWGRVLNLAVIAIVAVDIALVLVELFTPLSEQRSQWLHALTPWLIFIAAILPAAVASLNGIRFQSECRRMAERSAVMRTIIIGRSKGTLANLPITFFQKIKYGLWQQPIGLLRTLLPFLIDSRTIAMPDPAGSQICAAQALQAKIASAVADSATDPASWTPVVVRFVESVAEIFVHEVAEWSVLYAKEVPEP